MFSASQLSEEEVTQIHQWVADGADMAAVQKKLKEELGHSLTYMDTRFLALDLKLEFPSEEVEEEAEETAAEEPGTESPEPAAGGLGSVSVTVDQIARPGAVVSGRVSFSDGENALWLIDQMGRPSLDPDTAGYRPSENDLVAFQEELQKALDQGAF